MPPGLDEMYAHFLRAGGRAMSTILIIALKEVRTALRNRWVLAMTLLMAALALDAQLSRQRADRHGQGRRRWR